ncbi:hypothetical protein [Sphingobium algorifonticola]|jgi:hypothetical protein|uniref:Uncharacterized protein n=1 Tax=Sphingobium algorifonticola TaxID=2008318 RepID=A0A437J385_9SPHN|nr:hypothetical protein [Sphingobium algorifonticola]RVT38673.1 hypothetical protein ENE74_17450 [Sphingobium algorifonticola]
MSILFRIALPADTAMPARAIITARQLATFRAYLRVEGERIGAVLLEPDAYLGNSFEARVCPLALAAVTRHFDHDIAVIAVVEEAQFLGRRIAIHHDGMKAEISMRVALTSDSGLELDLANGNAFALLEALGMDRTSVGEITLDQLRARLSDPSLPARARTYGVDHYLPRMERLLASAAVMDDARLAWA